jgi:hypothetical protein
MELEIILVFAKYLYGTKFGKLGGMEMVNILVFCRMLVWYQLLGGGEGNGIFHYKGKKYTTKKTKGNPTHIK